MSRNSKPRLIIIDKHQFGYLTDPYKWCEYLREYYDITVLSGDLGAKKMKMAGVNVHYVPFTIPYYLRASLFVLASLMICWFLPGTIVVEYFKQCSILKKLTPWRNIIVDVRTLSINPDEKCRENTNRLLIEECGKFNLVTAISEGVAKQMNLPGIQVVPLGSDVISHVKKAYTGDVNMLYIGTLRWRRVEDTVRGVRHFLDANPDVHLKYDIIGDGEPGQVEQFRELVTNLELENVVTVHGRIPYDALEPYYKDANVGVCYVPVTKYYDDQPPTKTFEYILSGLYCVATATKSNRELITPENGVLIDDTPESFAEGIAHFIRVAPDLKESTLRNSLKDSTWEYIIKNKLLPVLISQCS